VVREGVREALEERRREEVEGVLDWWVDVAVVEKRDSELAKKIAKENQKLRDENLEEQLLLQYGLVKLGGSIRSARSAQ
jgi:hypothetical protein